VFINRFRYTATKAKQVQSRIKELDRMARVEIPLEEKAIHFSFPQPKPSGRMVAEFKQVAKSYGAKRVFREVSFTIQRGDRVALVGVNGAGKSTLIKLLAGIEPLSGGEYKQGYQVEVDYFAQDQYKALDADARLLDDLARAAPMSLSTQTELRSLLGSFLFSEDEVFKRIGVLSGGERNRYALARMLVRPSNFLLLDEPTNHLDLRAKDVLLEALAEYAGTVVFVSHDRYFIDKLATRVFEIAGGEVNVFPGNYEDYLWRKEGKEIDLTLPGLPDLVAERALSRQRHDTGPPPKAPATPAAVKSKRLNPIRLRQMKDRCHEIEEQVARREAEIEGSAQELTHFRSAADSVRLAKLIEQGREEVARLMREWEDTAKIVEEQEAEVRE
jgi:ATP-binding cassette subfamily F protein 3